MCQRHLGTDATADTADGSLSGGSQVPSPVRVISLACDQTPQKQG